MGIRGRTAVVGALTAAVMLAPGVARADIGGNLPPAADAAAWQRYVTEYRSLPDWAPRGTLIADSGFRSYPNGFSFFNTGVPDSFNHEVFGTPLAGPVNLDPQTMRDLMGKRVCLERSATGPCTLTLSGRQWMVATNAAMAGGHCFGFAATAADLFNGLLSPAQFEAGVTSTYDLGLREPISREIARNMATQYTFDVMKYQMTPRQVVETLRSSLRPSVTPFTLFIFWPGGGHGLTPYALHDKGNGQYDVAVYDNNYPDAARAIRIDTVKNTYRYLVATNPNGEPELAKHIIGLVPSEVIAGRQACPFCAAANETSVQLTPVRSQVPIKTRITDLDGRKIKGVVVNPPTNPWRPGQKWEFPTYTVPRKQDFVVTINNRRNSKPVATSLLATTGQFSIGTHDARVPARGVAVLGMIPDKGVVVYGTDGSGGDLGALVFTDDNPGNGVQVIGQTLSGDDVVLGRFDEQDKRVVLYTPDGQPTAARSEAYFQDATGEMLRADLAANIPRKGRLVIDYARWNTDRPKGIKAYVLAKGRQTPVKVIVR